MGIKRETIAGTERVRVTFTVPAATWADQVHLVGEFNDWDTTATPMFQTRSDGNWQATVDLPAGLRYRFRYLIDGQEWLNDWHADDFDRTPEGPCHSVIDLTRDARHGRPSLYA